MTRDSCDSSHSRAPRLVHTHSPPLEAVPVPPPSRPKSPPPTAVATVLVVEDDPQVRRIVIRALGRAGFDVLASGSYDEALAALAAHPRAPDVLLTDVRMPGENGPAISRELGRRFPGLRTVFMSGYSGEDVAEVGQLPADGLFVQKPFTIDGLVSKIREALRG
jgi:DNA-binding NtrC family response regulator